MVLVETYSPVGTSKRLGFQLPGPGGIFYIPDSNPKQPTLT